MDRGLVAAILSAIVVCAAALVVVGDPAVTGVISGDSVISDADAGAGLVLTVEFSEAMNTSVAPTLAFSPDVSATLSFSSDSWPDADTYQATYAVSDANADADAVTVDVTGAQDALGNPQQDYTPQTEFAIDTRNPSITYGGGSAGPTSYGFPVTQRHVGTVPDGGLYLYVFYDETVIETAHPTLSFPSEDPGGTLTFRTSYSRWLVPGYETYKPATYRVAYDVADLDVDIRDIDVRVDGVITDVHGNLAVNRVEPDFLDIDTKDPEVVSITPSTRLIIDQNAGTNTFTLTIVYNEPMDRGYPSPYPEITFPNEAPGTALARDLPTRYSSWLNPTTYVAQYTVVDTNLQLANIDVRVTSASQGGNVQVPYEAADVFSIDTLNTYQAYTITASAGAHGKIWPSGPLMVLAGEDLSYSITPDAGYAVDDVVVDGNSVGSVTNYTFEDVSAAHTISVTFYEVCTVATTAGLHGRISTMPYCSTFEADGVLRVSCGARVCLYVIPDPGYRAVDVVFNGTSYGQTGGIWVESLYGQNTLSATFERIPVPPGVCGIIDVPGDQTYIYREQKNGRPLFLGLDCTDDVMLDLGLSPSWYYHTYSVVYWSGSEWRIAKQTFVIGLNTILYTNAMDTATPPYTGWVDVEPPIGPAPELSCNEDYQITMTSSAGPNGSIDPSGVMVVDYGSDLTYTIAPAEHYHVAAVVVDGVWHSGLTSYAFTHISHGHTISATFAIDMNTIAASADPNGSIEPLGDVAVEYGADQTFTITPASCYQIADVLIDGVSAGPITSYTFVAVTAPHTISAVFALVDPFVITSSAGPGGTISPAGDTAIACGASQTFTITPTSCCHVADVTIDGVSIGAAAEYTFSNVVAAHTIAATFVEGLSIGATAGLHGTIVPSGDVVVICGSDQLFTISADEHYHVLDVLVDGASVGAVADYTFSGVLVPHTIEASFALDTAGITATAGDHGAIAPSGVVQVAYGADQTFIITPVEHYQVADVLVDGVSVGATTSYTFSHVTESHAISASFMANPEERFWGTWTNVDPLGGMTRIVIEPGTLHIWGRCTPTDCDWGVNPYTVSGNQLQSTWVRSFVIRSQVLSIMSSGRLRVDESGHYTDGSGRSDYSRTEYFGRSGVGPVTITASAGIGGAITPSGNVSVAYGADQAYTITPAQCFQITDVVVDGVSVGPVAGYTFVDVRSEHAIAAAFSTTSAVYTIAATADTGSSINPAGNLEMSCGASQTFAITADTCYRITEVMVDGVSIGVVTSYTFADVTADHTIDVKVSSGALIVATAGLQGVINPSGDVAVACGSNQTFTVTPAEHSHITDVLVDGVSVGAVSIYTFADVISAHSIAASFALDTEQILATAGEHGSIAPSGLVAVGYAQSQTFTITPEAHYQVLDVLVDGVSVGAVPSYTFADVTAPHTISASFTESLEERFWGTWTNVDPNTGGITRVVIQSGQLHEWGRCSPADCDWGTNPYTVSGSQLLTTWNQGFVIRSQNLTLQTTGRLRLFETGHYTDGSGRGDYTSTYFFNRSGVSPSTITASASSNGSITPSGNVSVAYGADQTFTIAPTPGYHVVDVLVDGVSAGAVTSYTFSFVTAAHTIEAQFTTAIDTFTIAASAGANGAIDPTGDVVVEYGASQTFTVIPEPCHRVSDVLVDGASVGAVTSFTFTGVTAPHTIEASFAAGVSITASAGSHGTIDPSGEVVVSCGADQVFAITPDANCYIVDVIVDGASVGAISEYTFAGVTSLHTIAATFAPLVYTITASAGPNGTISPSGVLTLNHGMSQTYTVAPATGYHVLDVLVDGTSVGAVTSYTFSSVTADHTISASFTRDHVITASAGPNGSITPSGAVWVAYGTSKTFTIAPAAGYHVVAVVVDGVAKGAIASYTFTSVTAPHTISATFAINTYTISASAGAGGTISPKGTIRVDHGASQTFTFTPLAHYHVATVLVDGVLVGVAPEYTFTNISAAHRISVTFAIDTNPITATAGPNGTITPAGTVAVPYNTSKAFTIAAKTGYHVEDVLVDGASVGAVRTYTFLNVIAPHTIEAAFHINPRTITASSGTGGTISPKGSIPVQYGESQTFTITPNAHYHVVKVLVDGVSVGAPTEYTFTNVIVNHTIVASFAIDTFPIVASASGSGTITPAGTATVNYGTSKTYTITPAAGNHIADVVVDGVSVGAVTKYTFTSVDAAHTIEARFEPGLAIGASAGPHGSISPSGTILVASGASQTFTVTPDEHYHVARLIVDGVVKPAAASYTFTNITTSHTLLAEFTLDTNTITATAGSGGTIAPRGAVAVGYGTDKTFALTPAAHYHVANMLVDGASIGAAPSYTFTNVTGPHTIVASFALDTNTITASAGPNGTITPAGDVAVNYGASRAFAITAASGYHVVDVVVDGVSKGAKTSYTFTSVIAPHTIAASFAINTYAITATAGPNGTISPSGAVSVEYGASRTFTISPVEHYHVVRVLVDGVSVGAVTEYTFTDVTRAHTIAATFAFDTYAITASAGPGGTISPAGAVAVTYGASRTFTITPQSGYHVEGVLVDGISIGAVRTYTFTNVTAPHIIAASFAVGP